MTHNTTPEIGLSAAPLDGPLFMRAVRGLPVQRPPVWLMRQAGQYLPEHRELRSRYGIWKMINEPELAAETSLQPLARFPLDAVLLFSDILAPIAAMGVSVQFTPGPVIEDPVCTEDAITRLRLPNAAEIAPGAVETIRLIRAETPLPIIGFCGGPLTLATYLVQGYGRGEQAAFRGWLHENPQTAHRLLELLTELDIRYLRQQVAAGADVIQVYDSWAGVLDRQQYAEYGLPYVRRILTELGELGVPRIYLATTASHLYSSIATLPAEVISVDWRMPLDRCRTVFGDKVLQGNLDPAALLAHPDQVRAKTLRVLREGAGGPHIFNLGHSILPQTEVDGVAALVSAVVSFAYPV
jgi:uroporphyrinogen decarboxylase